MKTVNFWMVLVSLVSLTTEAPPVLRPSSTDEETKRVYNLSLAEHPGFHILQFYVDADLLQIKLFRNKLYGEDSELMYLRSNGSKTSRRLNTNCYYGNGNVFHEHDNIGWASVFSCNKQLRGILTFGLHTYNLESDGRSYMLKLVGRTKKEFKIDLQRIKRHEHVVPENTIEVSLVVDEVMSSHYDDSDLEPYLLDLMNTVSHLFRHSSTGSIIKIILVKIIVFQSNELKISDDSTGAVLRDTFCKWQNEQHINTDIAILLTRRVICESDNQCGILGITNLGSMCQSSKSCAVVRDTGLSTAFTLTHEIGHSLGVYHDGDKNVKCDSGFFIMAASFQESDNPHGWSNCSRQQLNEFFSSSKSACLKNTPHTTVSPPLEIVPLLGKNYTLDEQCVLLFGDNARSCEKTNCSMLWCSLDGGKCNNTQYSPPAAGSACSVNGDNSQQHLCYSGECIESSVVSTVVHGGWGEWGPWSECTVTCSRGVQHSDRYCKSPVPQFSGIYCTGTRRQYRICNTQDCTPKGPDYRNTTCAELGAERGGQGLSATPDSPWVSVDENYIASFGSLNPCKLYCQRQGQGNNAVSVLQDSVQNGVSCVMPSDYIPGVCIDTKCIPVGCDGKLGTPTYKDKCGVLCGNNTTCTHIQGAFTLEILEILIPNGSRNIIISETVQSKSYLFVTDTHLGHSLNGSIGPSHGYLSGAWWYHDDVNHLDYLHCAGPTTHDTLIKVIDDGGDAVFNYSFIAPLGYQLQHYNWSVGEWSACSALCGRGSQMRTVTCTHHGNLVDVNKCINIAKPASNRTCQLESCDNYGWKTSPWSKCSTNCGSGIKEREVMCKHSNGSRVESGYCTTSVRPDERQTCHSSLCPSWEYGNWSQCSVTCGNGIQTRSVHCLTSTGSLSQECDLTTKPKEQNSCSIKCIAKDECLDSLHYCNLIVILEYCHLLNYNTECCKSCSNNSK